MIDAMIADSGKELSSLRVDGGATKSDFLMQFQADMLGIPVERPKVTEMAALGAAYLAGLGVGYWDSISDLEKHWKLDKRYEPKMEPEKEGGTLLRVETSRGKVIELGKIMPVVSDLAIC